MWLVMFIQCNLLTPFGFFLSCFGGRINNNLMDCGKKAYLHWNTDWIYKPANLKICYNWQCCEFFSVKIMIVNLVTSKSLLVVY